MTLEEAIAVYLYYKDSVEAWVEPARSAKAKAWAIICEAAKETATREKPSM